MRKRESPFDRTQILDVAMAGKGNLNAKYRHRHFLCS